ncbi:MAG: hypothetical protein ACLGJB_27200 [Blastocatellia bacterium]
MSVQAPASNPPTSVKYTIEQCAWCSGAGYRCMACDGNGLVLVRLPSSKCARCNGTGKERSGTASAPQMCAACSGTGWALVVKKSA